MVLTESRAKLYFPGVPVDKDQRQAVLTYSDGVDELQVTVSGIVKDLNENTDFREAEFISMATIAKTSLQGRFMMTVWNDWMAYSHLYVKLAPGGSHESAERQLADLFKKYNKDTNKQHRLEFRLQPLSDIHFNSNVSSPRLGCEFSQ